MIYAPHQPLYHKPMTDSLLSRAWSSPKGCPHPGVKPNDDYRKETMPFKCTECEHVFGEGEIEEVDGVLRRKDLSVYSGRRRRR